jgi:hypothetical protein
MLVCVDQIHDLRVVRERGVEPNPLQPSHLHSLSVTLRAVMRSAHGLQDIPGLRFR